MSDGSAATSAPTIGKPTDLATPATAHPAAPPALPSAKAAAKAPAKADRARRTRSAGLAAGDSLFDLGDAAQPQLPRPRPEVDHSDYDPDDFGDAVQVGRE